MVSYQNILEWGDATQIDIRRMRATIIFITLFPIILKYFTKGINLGGIKE
jgi:hypothetical protein